MIASELQRLLAAQRLPDDLDHPDLPRRIEAASEAAIHDARLRATVLEVHAWTSAGHGLPPLVGGVQRDRLIRCDTWTSTWEGTDAVSGARAQVRTLRAHLARDPMLRRALLREGRALLRVLPGLRLDADAPALTATLPGPAFHGQVGGGQAGSEALVRLVLKTVHHLAVWEDAGLGLADLAPDELCDASDHVAVVTLTPQPAGDLGPVLRNLARLVRAWWDDVAPHALADLLTAFESVPPATAADASEACRAAVATLLADERHRVRRRAHALRYADERSRLALAVDRLSAALPPPRGRAAVSVDLEGRTMVVHNLDHIVLLGPVGEAPEVLWSAAHGIDPGLTRRLLRIRGSAPVSERLNREVEGNPAYVDRITTWLAGQLELRTLRLLLAPRP